MCLPRVDTFKQFMETFSKVCILGDQRVHLTIVYFGEEGLNMAQKIVKNVSETYNFTHVTFLTKDTEFSRGVGLLSGAEAWDKGNVLMFFCDVDIYFDGRFLDRCRMNAEPGRKVYYPIVFSLYNPDIVYHGRNIPDWHDQLVIGKNSGYWRDFGFGMTCLYRSDFLYMKGFDTNIKGWGAEDVKLYRKFVSSNLEVVRAPDRGTYIHIICTYVLKVPYVSGHCIPCQLPCMYLDYISICIFVDVDHYNQLPIVSPKLKFFDNSA